MRAAGRPGRGERGRVAARVRELLAQHPDGPAARTDVASQPPGPAPSSAWLPDADVARHVPRHGGAEAGRIRWRWDPGRRGAAALGVLLIVVIAVTGWWLAAGRPHEVPISGPSAFPAAGAVATPSGTGAASLSVPASSTTAPPGPTPASSSTSASGSAAPIVVDVAGKVRHPGLYTLPPGARVDDAVRAAGGARRPSDLVSLNLAQPLSDGEQIVVSRSGSPPIGPVAPAPGTAAAGSSSPPVPVDLNTATLEELETLPGIGPVLGQHILDWRSANGQFTSIDQLRNVSGIGDVRFAELSPLVTL